MSWINFKEVKETISFETVLRHYGVEIKAKGEQHQGFCPLPNHSGTGKSPSFSANLKRGIYQCFGCGASGNLLDFAAMMEKVDPRDGKAVRVIAAKLLEQYGKGSCPTEPHETKRR